jgi:hypothetical protein
MRDMRGGGGAVMAARAPQDRRSITPQLSLVASNEGSGQGEGDGRGGMGGLVDPHLPTAPEPRSGTPLYRGGARGKEELGGKSLEEVVASELGGGVRADSDEVRRVGAPELGDSPLPPSPESLPDLCSLLRNSIQGSSRGHTPAFCGSPMVGRQAGGDGSYLISVAGASCTMVRMDCSTPVYFALDPPRLL